MSGSFRVPAGTLSNESHFFGNFSGALHTIRERLNNRERQSLHRNVETAKMPPRKGKNNMSNKGQIVGTLNIRELYIMNQEEAYATNEYLIAESNGKNIPLEVTESTAVMMLLPETVPGLNAAYLTRIKVDDNKPVFVAKAKVLVPLATPLFPNSVIRKPDFTELKGRLVHAEMDDALKLGVINGTEALQAELPAEYANLSPLWDDDARTVVDQTGVPFLLDFKEFRAYPHVGIFGSTGSGKSFGLRAVVEELMDKGMPGLVLDPHFEMEFSRSMDGLSKEHKKDFSDKYEIFYVGKNMGIPFDELTFSELTYLLEFVDTLSEPMKVALEGVYERGDTLAFLKQKVIDLKVAFEYYERPQHHRGHERLPEDLEKAYEKNKNRISSSQTLQALSWRLESLEGTNVFMKTGTQGIERAIQSGKMAILRGDMRRLQMVSFYTIRKLYQKRRSYQDYMTTMRYALDKEEHAPEFFPMFFIVVDEAHNFAPNGSSNPTKRILKTIAQEARKYGVFEIFCTQKPDGVDSTIFSQLNTKIIYRINTLADMQLIQQETNLTAEQMAQLPELQKGNCFISSATLPKTFSVRFRTTFTKSPHSVDPFAELEEHRESEDRDLMETLLVLAEGTIKVTDIPRKHMPYLSDELERTVTIEEVQDALDLLVKRNMISSHKTPMGLVYKAS